jgi:hypothetical protein
MDEHAGADVQAHSSHPRAVNSKVERIAAWDNALREEPST